MWLDLVGTRIEVGASDAATQSFFREQWSEFVGGEERLSDADLRLDARVDESILGKGPAPEAKIVRFDGECTLERHDFMARWDEKARRADVTYVGSAASMSSFMRVILSMLLRREGGVLFHAASVRRTSGEVVLFPGVSGTGKSTIASLSAPRGILSDEISALRPSGKGGARAYPTPFWGDLVRSRAADSAPLESIVLLRRGGEPAVLPAAPRDAFAALLEGALFFEDPRELAEKRVLVDAVRYLAESARCLRLQYDLPRNPWPLLDGP